MDILKIHKRSFKMFPALNSLEVLLAASFISIIYNIFAFLNAASSNCFVLYLQQKGTQK